MNFQGSIHRIFTSLLTSTRVACYTRTLYVRMRMYMCVFMYVLHMHVCMYEASMYICIHVIYVCNVCMCVCMYIYIYVCVCVCVCVCRDDSNVASTFHLTNNSTAATHTSLLLSLKIGTACIRSYGEQKKHTFGRAGCVWAGIKWRKMMHVKM
jgi:hypothetical protein